MKVTITREKLTDKQTLGTLVLNDDEGNKLFTCKTLELAWNENKKKRKLHTFR